MTGGRTALAGFLYQIIRTLEFAATAIIRLDTDGSCSGMFEILEPEPDSGGDLQVCSVSTRVVVQYKIRRGKTPWQQNEIIGQVLPDLYKAVWDVNDEVRYVFSTDGTVELPKFRAFLKLFDPKAAPNDPLLALDDTERDYLIGNGSVTARKLFCHVAKKLVPTKAGPTRADYPRIWRLLARFEIEDNAAEASAVAAIKHLLGIVVDRREDVSNKFNELIGVLAQHSRDRQRFSSDALFREAGLDPRGVGHAVRLPALLSQQLADDARHLGYVRDGDVRHSEIGWPSDKALLALTGESGFGKTWQLCRLAHRLCAEGHLVVLLPADIGVERIETEVVRRVWLSGGYDEVLDIAVVADRLRPRLRGDDPYWLTLCIDDVQDRQLARDLASPRWRRMGIRIALSAQGRIGAIFNPAEQVCAVPVPVFTPGELRDYLTAGGRSWNRLPDDVLELLRRPILAKLYRELDGGTDWAPHNEYALMDRYWRFATSEKGDQADCPSDAEVLKRLAGTVLDDKPLYPWPIRTALKHGIDDAMRLRLITVGLLRDEAGHMAMSHDRLLNWAVAEYLADCFQDGALTIDQLGAHLCRSPTPGAKWNEDFALRRLGYVPIDVVWLLANKVPPDHLAKVLLIMTRNRQSRYRNEGLFHGGLLDSLGERIVPVLEALLRQPLDEHDWEIPRCIGGCLAVIGRNEPKVVAATATRLLDRNDPRAREAALVALGKVAAPALLDRLWAIHLDHHRIIDKTEKQTTTAYRIPAEQSFAALASAVAADPEWIARKIHSPGACERADQLVYLMQDLDPLVGHELWRRTKEAFFGKVTRNRDCLAQTAGIYRDREEIGRLETWVAEDGERHDEAVVLSALTRIAPDRAIGRFSKLPKYDIWLCANWWLPGLLHRAGNSVYGELLALHADGGWEKQRELALVFNGREIYLDAAIVRVIVAALEERLAAVDNDPDWRPRGEGHLLRLLAHLTRLDLMAVLEEQRGSRFEYLLVKRAVRRSGRFTLSVDGDGDQYRRILLAIGGEGIGQLVEAELRRASPFARIDALEAAIWCPTESIRQRLRIMAEQCPDDEREAWQLAYVLAALGEDKALAQVVADGASVLESVLAFRQDRPSFAPAIVADAIAAVNDD